MTTKTTPAESVAKVLSAIDPLLANRPIYIICKTHQNAHLLPGNSGKWNTAWGWTGNSLAMQCKGFLESAGQWKGDGFAMIYNKPVGCWDNPQFLATCCHEAAHWFEWNAGKSDDHAATFYRAACHVHQRVSIACMAFKAKVSLPKMLSGNAKSPLVASIADTLADEVQQVSKPITWHLKQPMPVAFWAIFNPRPTAQLTAPPTQKTVSASPSKNTAAASDMPFVCLQGGRLVVYHSDGRTE